MQKNQQLRMMSTGVAFGGIRENNVATVIVHRKIRIVLLAAGEAIADHCRPGDIAIVSESDGFRAHFLAADGSIDAWEQPYASEREALWSAKAAAEFGGT